MILLKKVWGLVASRSHHLKLERVTVRTLCERFLSVNRNSKSTDDKPYCGFAFVAEPKISVDEIEVELDWVRGIREQVEFLNAAMKHHCILLRVQRRGFVTGRGTA